MARDKDTTPDAAAVTEDVAPLDAVADGDALLFDTEAEPEATATSSDDPAQLLEEAQRTIQEQREQVLRVQAEMDNLRKRSVREVENAHKFGLERLISELLPVKDSMELGLVAASDEAVDVAKVREGLEMTLRMWKSSLEKFGVEEVDPAGETFDPELHEAMSMQESDEAGSGTVITVFQKGYTLNGRLVRPAKVVVAK